MLLFGDFNFPAINWTNLTSATSQHSTESDFVNSCLTFGLTQLVTEPTRQSCNSSNILDLIFASDPDKVYAMTHLPGLSDHSIIHASYSCQLTQPTKITKVIKLYDKGNYSAINSELAHFAASFHASFFMRSVETNWLLFKNKMLDVFARYVPVITLTEKQSSPWFNITLKRLNNKKKRLFRSAKRFNNAGAWNKYYLAEKEFEALANKEKRTFFRKRCRLC